MLYLKEIFYLLGGRRRKLPWLIGLFLASSMLDLLGLGLIVPYMLLILDPSTFYEGYMGALFQRLDSSLSENEVVVTMSLMLLCVFLFKAVAAIIINKVIISFSWNLQLDLKALLMKSYQNLDYTEYLQRNSAEYILTIQNYTLQYTSSVLQSFLMAISESIAVLVILIMLAMNNASALAMLVVLIGTFGIGYDRIFKRRTREYGKQSNLCNHEMVQAIREGTEGLKEIRMLGRESYFYEIVKKSSKGLAKYNGKMQLINIAPRYLLELALVIFITLLVLSALRVNNDLQTLVPTLSLFGLAAIRLIPSANMLISSVSRMRFGRHATHCLYNDIRKINVQLSTKVATDYFSKPPEKFKDITLKNVCFNYPNTDRHALLNISLNIKNGESIGLIGSSGSGKTTLVDMILGLFEPDRGNIFYNGRIFKESLPEWRKNIAYLPQQILLIDSTLRKNVALGVPENEINEGKLIDALQQARLSELVEQLPEGLETMLGERGVRLSGGQRQRVALARAFYHDRNVLVMDEATSALDNETEKEIVEEIRRLKGNKTVIVIAHRLTTVQHCDMIYRLDNGEIVEQGTYESVVGRQEGLVS